MDESRLRDLCQQLLEINREAFDTNAYGVAYHALVAAFECLKELKEADRLLDLSVIAETQLKWIDTHHPDYRHSTPAAAQKGTHSIFEMLARQARAEAMIIHTKASLTNKGNDTPSL